MVHINKERGEYKRFTAGGTIHGDDSIYVQRESDFALRELVLAGELGYILTSRQMGKSSMMVRTTEHLLDAGHHPVIIDLSEMGVSVTAEQWYFCLFDFLQTWLSLETDPLAWWHQHQRLGHTKLFFKFLTDVVLHEIEGKVILFFDEIDTTINLPFADDFFAEVRALYNNRYQYPQLQRLSIVLIGTATPNDLIKDPKRTIFNIGRRIELNNFTLEEAYSLTAGFHAPAQVG